jgi:hypothetical protein
VLSRFLISSSFLMLFPVISQANATFIDFSLKGLAGYSEATTQSMSGAIQKEIIDHCQAISSRDKVVLVSETVSQSWSTTANDIFRESKLVLRRTDSKNQYSYQIQIETLWDQDLPSPQPFAVAVKSKYCK